MSVLYRKYRPQTFADVAGQEHVTRTLLAALAHGRVAHAYLFSGSRGVGKTTTARLLARAVNCERRTQNEECRTPDRERRDVSVHEPCNACPMCAEITDGRCMDVVEIDAASHTGVDHVREHIIDAARLAPSRAQWKVFIVDEVHMLSPSAFNALLKTLEEPPAHVVFILATTELHRVPETIQSRCQHFAFRPIALAAMTERLAQLATAEGVTVESGVLDAVARAGRGSLRDAETLFGQLLAMGEQTITATLASVILPRSSVDAARALVDAVIDRDARVAVDVLRRAEEDGVDAEAYGRDTIAEIRERLHAAIARGGIADGATAPLMGALRQFVESMDTVRDADTPFLGLEVAALGAATSGLVRAESAERTPTAVVASPVRLVRPEPTQSPPVPPSVPIPAPEPPSARAQVPSPRAPAASITNADADRMLSDLRARWSALVAAIGETHASLPYLLEGGRPQRIDGDTLVLGFRYKLHAEKVRDPRVVDAVSSAVSAVAGTSLRIATVVVSTEEFSALDATVRPKTGDAVADAALAVFGGRVVE